MSAHTTKTVSSGLRLAAGAATCALLGACGAANPSPQDQAPARPSTVERYFPLGDGYAFTYDTVREDSGARDRLMLRVERISATEARIHTTSGVRHVLVSDAGIQRREGGWVLRAPLREHASWQGDNGGQTRVESMSVEVTVPAGSFEGCVRTVEEIEGAQHGKISSVFCPDVGLAWMRVEQWQGGSHEAQRFELRSFGPPVDLGASR